MINQQEMQRLVNNGTPNGTGVDTNSPPQYIEPQQQTLPRIQVKQLNGEQFNLDIDLSSTIMVLKTLINELRSIPMDRQRLIFAGRELEDHKTMNEYAIKNGSTLHIVLRQNVPPVGPVVNNGAHAVNLNQGAPWVQQGPFAANAWGNNAAAPGADMPQDWNIIRLCRFIRWFALIDGVFMLLWAISFKFFGFYIGSLFAVAGFIGAKQLNRPCLLLYGVLLIGEIGFRLWFMTAKVGWLMVVLSAAMIIINFYVLRCVLRLYRAIPNLSDEQRSHILLINRMGFF